MIHKLKFFDSHFHIINPNFPLVSNQGYLPKTFNCEQYLERTNNYQLCGGAIVSGSFQAFDQSYLLYALKKLGPSFVGVTQLPVHVSDQQLIELDHAGVRALRFNLKRGGSEHIQHLETMAKRIYELLGWHIELYVDSKILPDLYSTLINLPAVSIDHLGLSKEGFSTLLKLCSKGVKVKATGFSRSNMDIHSAIRDLYAANPTSLMFGTDLPSTRAPIPYRDEDYHLVLECLELEAAENVFYNNAVNFYKPKGRNPLNEGK